MFRPGSWKRILVVPAMLLALASPAAWAQEPWLAFTDPASDSICGVINSANAELIVLPDTLQLTKINGVDTLIENAFFDPATTDVVVNGESFGFVTFTLDADGNRTVWWVTSVSNNAVELDEFTFAIGDSGLVPAQISGAVCDPTPLIDSLNVGDGTGSDPSSNDTLTDALVQSLCGAGTIGVFGTLFGLCAIRIGVRRPAAR